MRALRLVEDHGHRIDGSLKLPVEQEVALALIEGAAVEMRTGRELTFTADDLDRAAKVLRDALSENQRKHR
jgi:hypothetical protein